MTKSRQAPNFDRIARLYRWAEYLALGPILQRTRTHHLPRIASRKRALILGDGDGRFTATLLAANREVRVHAVDSSIAMLQLLQRNAARQTFAGASRLRITHANALEISPSRDTDLIVTHFFLDCLTQPELETLVHRIAPAIRPGTLWLVSEFRIPEGRLHLPARIYIRALYLAFRILTGLRVTTLPDHVTPLRAAGFTLIAIHRPLFGILTTELWQR